MICKSTIRFTHLLHRATLQLSLPKLKNKIPCKFSGISWKNRKKILLKLIEQEKDGGNLYQHHQKDIAWSGFL